MKTENREEKIKGLLTDGKGYTDQNSAEFRKTLIPVICNEKLRGFALSGAVAASIQGLRAITITPLEIADLIHAWAIMFPTTIPDVLQGVREALIRHDRHAEGILLGCFQAIQEAPRGKECADSEESILNLLKHIFREEYWKSAKCPWTPHVSGRLTSIIHLFVSPVWAPVEPMRHRLIQLCNLATDVIDTDIDQVMHQAITVHDCFAKELYARIFLSAPPTHQREIFLHGLKSTIATLPLPEPTGSTE